MSLGTLLIDCVSTGCEKDEYMQGVLDGIVFRGVIGGSGRSGLVENNCCLNENSV